MFMYAFLCLSFVTSFMVAEESDVSTESIKTTEESNVPTESTEKNAVLVPVSADDAYTLMTNADLDHLKNETVPAELVEAVNAGKARFLKKADAFIVVFVDNKEEKSTVRFPLAAAFPNSALEQKN